MTPYIISGLAVIVVSITAAWHAIVMPLIYEYRQSKGEYRDH